MSYDRKMMAALSRLSNVSPGPDGSRHGDIRLALAEIQRLNSVIRETDGALAAMTQDRDQLSQTIDDMQSDFDAIKKMAWKWRNPNSGKA